VFDLREEALLLLEGRGGVLEAARKLSRLMREGQVDAAVIGGVAVVLHGHVRTTRDVDLLLRQPLDSIRALLESGGAVYRSEQRECILDGVPVHLVDEALAQPPPQEKIEIEAVTTVSLPDLINLKLRSGLADLARAQDLADVIGLIRHHRLRGTFAARIDRSLRADFRRLSKAALR
jgi:hypothetical protein